VNYLYDDIVHVSRTTISNLTWMSTDGHGTKWRKNIAGKLQLREYGERTKQTTDRRTDGRQHFRYIMPSPVTSRSLTSSSAIAERPRCRVS